MIAKKKIVWAPYEGSQKRIMSCPVWEALLHGNRGGGKGLKSTEKVLTPRGWTTMGELKVGSVISNPDGTSQTVIQIFNREKQQMYRLFFSDGTEIDSDGDHLWFTKISSRIKGKKVRNFSPLNFYGSIHNTQDLYELLKKHPNKHPSIPCPDPIKYQQNWKTDINPYIIGLILGDGSISKKETRISTGDKEIADYLQSFGANILKYKDKPYSCHFSRNSEISSQIDSLKLRGKYSHTKFLPKRLLQGSVKERLGVLQGLMDSDGTVSKKGQCRYCTASPTLAKDVRQLILSLGGWATITKKRPSYTYNDEKRKGKIAYILYIQFPNKEDLFRLGRKKERVAGNDYMHGRLVRSVISIKKLEKKEKTICIIVNNPNRLFITKDFLVTHNTDVLLMDYLQGVGKGHGSDYKGLLLREATTELGDVITKSNKWFPRIFPGSNFNKQKKIWTFPDGETLWLNYARVIEDYDQYHGHEYPWIGWEELTNHAVDEVYLKLMSCNRTSNPDIFCKYRSTCNPSGPGHAWVKERFIDKVDPGRVFRETIEMEIPDENGDIVKSSVEVDRTHIQSYLSENKGLLEAQPTYQAKIWQMTGGDEMLRKAWIEGSWDITIGGFFTDVWRPEIHVLTPFKIPWSWTLLRSFDWGSTKPWSVTYGFEANGEQPEGDGIPHIPAGSFVICDEIYGWTGEVNKGDQATSGQIADRVSYKDAALMIEYGVRVEPGPADTSIWEVKDGTSVGANLESLSCHWTRAYKGSGSRIAGWAVLRQMLNAAKEKDAENPHLYFFKAAQHHIRTLPMMQRDPKKPEDIDTDLEDHAMDGLRYLLTRKMTKISRRKVRF